VKAKHFIVLLSLAFLVVFPGLALAQYGSISGTVTDEVTGLPIMGAHVRAIGDTCHGGGCGDMTDSAGFYMIQHLPPGAYLVTASAFGYESEVYPESVIVVAGQNTPNIDFALTPAGGGGTGSISGRVTDETTGLPLPMAHVWAHRDICPPCGGEAWTDTAGYYLIQHLGTGQYTVGVHKDGYEDETYPELVSVVEGQNTPNIDFALAPISGPQFGSISGRVTDEVTGLPIIGAEIRLSGMWHNVWHTDSAGYYACDNVPVGFYIVSAHAIGYYPETYPDSVQVIEGQNTPNIDFVLAPMGGGTGSISGRVTDAETGLPIPMAHVWAHSEGGHPCCGGEAWTDTAGYYLIQNLAPRQYTVGVHKCGYQDAVYPELVTVYDGQNTPNIDFALTPMGEPGSISGTVTDQVTGAPIRCAHVSAYGEFGHGDARTDSLGNYTIHNLYPGSYFVTAWAMHYYPQDYPDTVIVLEGQNTPNIDFALVPHGGPGEGVIAGQVFEDTTFLMPIPFAVVFAISSHGNWGFDFSDSMGAYTIQGLQTNDYYVYAFACGYIGEFYDGVYTWEDATLVIPNAYNINFFLGRCGQEGGNISGVTNSNGSPLEGAFVYAIASGEVKGFARSSTDGGYVINGLLPGTYTVTASMVMYHDGYYPDPVEVMIGKVGEVDINLPPVLVGDVTGEGSINVADVLFLINYLYIGGPAPDPLMTGDANCDGEINAADVVYIINYLFIQGPSPCNP
jgi:protocatechuate 3,4-dioxygenase beta subunit